MTKDLIVDFLEANPLKTAKEIAKFTKLEKGEVNSILYSGVNSDFHKVDGSPPRWEIFKKTMSKGDLLRECLRLKNDSTFSIDSYGLIWSVRVILSSQSRNDPFFRIERVSPTQRIISISDALILEQEISESMVLPDSILAIAASAIAWEVSLSDEKSKNEEFDFGVAVTDVLISLASQNTR
jgi:hypothetical protein